MDYLIEHAYVVNEGSVSLRDVLISNGRFASVKEYPKLSNVERFDASGYYLLPGVIDTHVHFRDAGCAENESANFGSESQAAVAGGVTSVIDMPNTNPQTTSVERLVEKEHRASDCSRCNYGFMLGVTNDNVKSLLNVDPLRYAALKLFMGSSTGGMLVNEPQRLDLLFENTEKLVVAHCEHEQLVQTNLKNYRATFEGTEQETARLHPYIRSAEACYIASQYAARHAQKYGKRLHIAHISSASELQLLSQGEITEKLITAEVTPNHLWYDDRDYATFGNMIKCNPSIKSKEDRMALWDGLFHGQIDTIGSDHAPHPLAAKQASYFKAPSGIPSVQHTLRMMIEPYFNLDSDQSGNQDLLNAWLPLVVSKMSHNPALLFGIKDRGYIREGYHADLVLVRKCEGSIVNNDDILYRCGWSPLVGSSFHSEVVATFVNGEPVYRDGIVSNDVRGMQLQYDK